MKKQIDLAEIGKAVLRRVMERERKNQNTIAKELKKQPSTVTRWLDDGQNISPDTKSLNLIFNKYQITLDEVIMEFVPKEQAELLTALAKSDQDMFRMVSTIMLSGDERIIKQVKEHLYTICDYLENKK